MSEFYIEQVNDYTVNVHMNGKKAKLTDRAIRQMRRDAREAKRCKIGNRIHKAALTIGMIAAFYILGIVGHSDYCTEAGIADDWSAIGYCVRFGISFFVIWLCSKASNFGIEMRGYYVDWEEEK